MSQLLRVINLLQQHLMCPADSSPVVSRFLFFFYRRPLLMDAAPGRSQGNLDEARGGGGGGALFSFASLPSDVPLRSGHDGEHKAGKRLHTCVPRGNVPRIQQNVRRDCPAPRAEGGDMINAESFAGAVFV